MARTLVTLTDSWQSIATTRAVFTVETVPARAQLSMNDAASDATALRRVPRQGDQVAQTDAVTTYAKGEGIVLIVDAE